MRVSQTVKRMMDEDADYTKGGKKTGKAGDVMLGTLTFLLMTNLI
jgi:hypothetical protein